MAERFEVIGDGVAAATAIVVEDPKPAAATNQYKVTKEDLEKLKDSFTRKVPE